MASSEHIGSSMDFFVSTTPSQPVPQLQSSGSGLDGFLISTTPSSSAPAPQNQSDAGDVFCCSM